jgi:hypothetical protein
MTRLRDVNHTVYKRQPLHMIPVRGMSIAARNKIRL